MPRRPWEFSVASPAVTVGSLLIIATFLGFATGCPAPEQTAVVGPEGVEETSPPRPLPRPVVTGPRRPAWVDGRVPPPRDGKVFFRGTEQGWYADQGAGFDAAERRALASVVNSISVHITSEVITTESTEDRLRASSEIRTWASASVKKSPGREEHYDEDQKRYCVLISVPEWIVTPTSENLARFLKEEYVRLVGEGKDEEAFKALQSLLRVQPLAANRLLLFDYLYERKRWTEALEVGELLVKPGQLDRGSKDRARVKGLLAELRKKSPLEVSRWRMRVLVRLANMRVGIAALVGPEKNLQVYTELEGRLIKGLRGVGLKKELRLKSRPNARGKRLKVRRVGSDLKMLTVWKATENVSQVRGLVAGQEGEGGADLTHVLMGRASVQFLGRAPQNDRLADIYVAWYSWALVDLEKGEVVDSVILKKATDAAVRLGAGLEERTAKCRSDLAARALAALVGEMPFQVQEYVNRR